MEARAVAAAVPPREGLAEGVFAKLLKDLVDLTGVEPVTS